jgi:multidrug resistance efflux pump
MPEGAREKRRWRRRWTRRAAWIGGTLLLAGFLLPVRVRIAANGYVTTDDYAEVRPAETGPVAAILAESGQTVQKGDMLVRLDDRVQRAARDEAVAAISRIEALIACRTAAMEQQQRQQEHLIAQAEIRLAHAETGMRMTADLHAKGLDSGRSLEDRKTALALSRAECERLRAEDPAALAGKEIEVLQRELDMQRNVAAKVDAQLQTRHILAPISGLAVRYEFVTGELVTPQNVLYEIFGGDRQILKLRIPERHAAQVKSGAPYKAVLSIYTGIGRHRFRGKVSALRSVIQSDNQQTYRMAYCTFDDDGRAVPPGTSAEARVTVATVPFWFWLFGVR